MALKVGSLYAELTLDNKRFDRGLSDSGQRFEGLKSTIAAGTQVAAKAFAATTTAVVGIGAAAVKVGLDYNRMQQSSRAALTTLLGSAEAANAQMDKLDEFARSSPFAKQVFITAQQQLLGFGVQAEKVIPALDAIQNAVAAVGGSNEQVANVTYALAQMQSQGKFTGETIRDLGVYGIDAASIIGENFGKTGAEIRKMASKPGGIPADQVWDPLVNGLMERFGGATDNIKQQMDGAADRVKGAWRDIGAAIAAPFIDPKGGGYLVGWTNDVADGMRNFEAKLKPLVDLLVRRFTPGLAAVSPLLQQAGDLINRWDLSKVNGQLDSMTKYTPLIAGVSTALFTLGTKNLPIVGGAINPVVAGFAALAATSPEIRTMLSNTATQLQPLLPLFGDLGRILAETAVQALERLTPALAMLVERGADIALIWGSALIPAVSDLVIAGTPLIDMLAQVVEWMASLPTPVLAGAAAFIALRGPLGDIGDAVSGPLKAAFSGMSEYMAASAAVAEATGGQVSALGAAARASTGFVTGIGTALKTAFVNNAVGLAITGITAALSYFIGQQTEARQRLNSLRDTLDQTTAAITEQTRAWLYDSFVKNNDVKKAAEDLGLSMRDLVDMALDPANATLARLRERADEANAGLTALTADGVGPSNAGAVKSYADEHESLWLILREVGVATEEVQGEQVGLTQKLEAVTIATDGATTATGRHAAAQADLRDELEQSADAAMTAAEAALRLTESQQRAEDAVKELKDAEANLATLRDQGKEGTDEYTAAERRLTDAKNSADRSNLDLAKSSLADFDAKVKQNASAADLRDSIMAARESFIQQRIAMGDTREEAAKLASEYGLIPERVFTTVGASGLSDVLTRAQALNDTLNTINGKTVSASVAIKQYGQAAMATGGDVSAVAQAMRGLQTQFDVGGAVRGPGTGTSDSVPAIGPWGLPFRLSNGEHVWTAAEVAMAGGQGAMYRMRAAVRAGELGFAGGGGIDLAKWDQAAARYGVARAGFGTAPSSAPAAPVAQVTLPPIYVTNPFTGEQVRAVVRTEASAVTSDALSARDRSAAGARATRGSEY